MNLSKLPIKRYVVVGSQALQLRIAKDIDVVCYRDDIQVPVKAEDDYMVTFEFEGKQVECLLADKQLGLQRLMRCELQGNTFAIAGPAWQFILKAGHIHTPHRKWDIHIHDYHILKRISDYEANKYWMDDDIKQAKKDTALVNGSIKNPTLKGISKEDFFDDGIKKIYDHDNIHRCVAHREKPMYTYMQNEGDDVECQKELWEKFTLQEKVNTVLEECYVITIERFLLNNPQHRHRHFKTALYKVCTTLTSGWFRNFAINHYYEILNQYDDGFYNKFMENIEKYETIKH